MEDESRAAYSTGGHAHGAYIPYSSVTPVTDHIHLRDDQHSESPRKKVLSRSCMRARFISALLSQLSPAPQLIAQHMHHDSVASKTSTLAEKGMHSARSARLRAAAVWATGRGAGRTISSVRQGAYLEMTRQKRAPPAVSAA